jgi:hypothetical protein
LTCFTSASVPDGRAPRPKSTPRIALLFPTSTIALNPPPLKLYNCVNFTLDNNNEFAKGQGYAVRAWAWARAWAQRQCADLKQRRSSQISPSAALQITVQSTQSAQEQADSVTGGITGVKIVEVKMLLQMACQVLAAIFHRLTAVVGPYSFSTTLLRGPLVYSGFNLNSISYVIVKIKT